MSRVAIDSLRLHPDSERVPVADRSDLAALRASLDVNGQQDPLDVTSDGVILDGGVSEPRAEDFMGVNLPADPVEIQEAEWAYTLSRRGWQVVRWDDRPYLPRQCPGIPRGSCLTTILASADYCSFCRGTLRYRRRAYERAYMARRRATA